MRLPVTAGIAALALLCGPAVSQSDLSAEEVKRLCIAEKDDKKALPVCGTAIREKKLPGDLLALAYVRRAEGLLRNPFDRMQAATDLDSAILLHPESQRAYFVRAELRHAEQDYENAVADYSEAIRLDPRDFEAYNNRACTRNSLGRYDSAIVDLEAAIRLNPRARAAHSNRGFMAIGEGRFIKAYNHFRDATSVLGPAELQSTITMPLDYFLLWSYVALARSEVVRGKERADEALNRRFPSLGKSDTYRPIVEYYLGRIDEQTLRGRMPKASTCDVDYFVAQRHMILGDVANGLALLHRVADTCPTNHHEHWAARLELRRMGRAEGRKI